MLDVTLIGDVYCFLLIMFNTWCLSILAALIMLLQIYCVFEIQQYNVED